MVLNAAVQMLREADELKQKILKFKSGTSMLQERSLWVTQQQLQKVYQKVLVLDLDYALEKKVEQDLWNVGFKQQIEALQAISKDRKSHLRSEGQAMLAWVLQAAAGFYLCLLHQICTTFKLDLPFRRRASLLGWVEGWGAGEATGGARLPPPAAARYICQHCLVHLGDLARYRQQLRVAHTFYRHALVVSAHSGQPYNQLALVAWRRGRRLGALYWHVRSLLVRAPFPPAPANLARTLAAAAGGSLSTLPVLPGVSGANGAGAAGGRLHAPGYVTALIRAAHMIHNVEQLETAETIVESLNSSLTALIATDSFESMTLIKMSCVLIWLVHSSNEDFKVDRAALSDGEAQAARLSEELAAAAMLALLLPAYTLQAPPERALPALKVWLQWCVQHTEFVRGAAWRARAALWPALAHTLNALAPLAGHITPHAAYETVPLPEDEELHGFLPLEEELKPLRFANHAAWDAYGGRVPDVPESAPDDDPPAEVPASCLSSEPELERRLRALRLVRLGRRLADMFPEHLQCNEEDGVRFTATSVGGEQLSAALAELSLARVAGGEGADEGEGEDDSDDEPERAPPPIVISEADFREKVREKRVGILKPQGSLERAREERAMASTQDDPESDGAEDISKSEDKKDLRKPRVNIAMAAIMRKQEESNKQVKFVTPPPTPDTTGDSTEAKDQDKPKVIQPKAIKNLANLPLGRKTGGILSLKDKSAGYPHLQNTDPEPPKKDKEDKKEPKPNQGSSQNSQQSYQPKRQDMPPPNWSPNMPPPNIPYDGPRVNFQKNYGIQNAGISYNPNYPSPPNVNNQGIRLPVVNPKEIDVRTAALQKQNSRQELFQDGHKFGNYSYHVSGDKKNFLNDLPPRFANQYRNWQAAQDSQFNDNKFRDDSFKPNALFNSQQPNWANPPPENYPTQPMPWWKPENPPPNFSNSPSYSPAMGMQPNFYSHVAPNLPNYQNMPSFNQMQNQSVGQQKPENVPNYLPSTIGQPQLQTLQNMVSSPNFNSSLNNFGSYAPTVGYDSAMYPQFNNNKVGYQPMQMKMMDKPSMEYQANKNLMDIGGLGFGSIAMDMQQRNLGIKFPDNMSSDNGAKNMDPIASGSSAGEVGGNTYSLFSGAPDSPAWGASHHHPQQSLWSGPGPSPLERLLEQQKQLKQPPAPH
ncbi:protein SMG7-like isoform X3 [Ostrinia furnacalis]|uniref:protein SMG7-like isoform X3 n=1 Tax=Ostrinia furnacalis TaxID=93504 RepID=UPI00103BA436|nr:protein SMG7-like isoform X3 [Ostrinia furnacalis]